MTHEKGAKLEPPLKLEMSFEEALSRFIQTNPKEVDEGIARSKQKKPPEDGSPGGKSSGQSRGHNRKPGSGE